VDVSRGLSGLFPEVYFPVSAAMLICSQHQGLYTGKSADRGAGSVVMIERDDSDPSMVGLTGVLDSKLYFEQVRCLLLPEGMSSPWQELLLILLLMRFSPAQCAMARYKFREAIWSSDPLPAVRAPHHLFRYVLCPNVGTASRGLICQDLARFRSQRPLEFSCGPSTGFPLVYCDLYSTRAHYP
jgi:hypothetical protein